MVLGLERGCWKEMEGASPDTLEDDAGQFYW